MPTLRVVAVAMESKCIRPVRAREDSRLPISYTIMEQVESSRRRYYASRGERIEKRLV
jgi:hypothetical protein